MNFRLFAESIASNQSAYMDRLHRLFPDHQPQFYNTHMQKILDIEKKDPNPPDFNDTVFNKYINNLTDQLSIHKDFHDKTTYGSAYPNYEHGLKQKHTKNTWVKNSANPSNENRILACQFSSTILYAKSNSESNYIDDYGDNLYAKRQGYVKPHDFWEIPYWIAILRRNLDNVDLYVIRDMQEAITFFNQAKYKVLVFSAMDVAVEKIKQIASQYNGKIGIGGYSDTLADQFIKFKNVNVFNNMNDFVLEQKSKNMEGGVDYSLFQGTQTIPRLSMSTGCKHGCKFCTVPKNVEEMPEETIKQEADAIAELKTKLVYLNDKTFGQANNYTLLPKIFWEIKQKNKNFEGFIVQTTAAALSSKRLSAEFIKDSGIRFIEVGVESYNDPILRNQKKPATEKLIDACVNRIREARKLGANVWFIPNIITGFPEETEETYQHTYNFLLKNQDIISHGNIYNLAIYNNTELEKTIGAKVDSDRDENQVSKSFHTDPKLHEKWHKKFIDLANEMLNKHIDISASNMKPFSQWIQHKTVSLPQRTAG